MNSNIRDNNRKKSVKRKTNRNIMKMSTYDLIF